MTTPPQGQNPFAQGQAPYPPQGQAPYPPQGSAPYPPQGGYPQQPGQPGVPPQAPYAPFPNQGGAPVPPPAPAGKRMGKKAIRIIGAIVVAVIVGLLKFGAGWFLTRDDAETTSVGACMHNDGSNKDPELKEVDCSSSEAQYKVVQKFDGSSDDSKCEAVTEATISYVQYGHGHDVVLCLKDAK
ncbi:LppU/SCO3897 family protein [Streptomyces sp. NPDC001107]